MASDIVSTCTVLIKAAADGDPWGVSTADAKSDTCMDAVSESPSPSLIGFFNLLDFCLGPRA